MSNSTSKTSDNPKMSELNKIIDAAIKSEDVKVKYGAIEGMKKVFEKLEDSKNPQLRDMAQDAQLQVRHGHGSKMFDPGKENENEEIKTLQKSMLQILTKFPNETKEVVPLAINEIKTETQRYQNKATMATVAPPPAEKFVIENGHIGKVYGAKQLADNLDKMPTGKVALDSNITAETHQSKSGGKYVMISGQVDKIEIIRDEKKPDFLIISQVVNGKSNRKEPIATINVSDNQGQISYRKNVKDPKSLASKDNLRKIIANLNNATKDLSQSKQQGTTTDSSNKITQYLKSQEQRRATASQDNKKPDIDIGSKLDKETKKNLTNTATQKESPNKNGPSQKTKDKNTEMDSLFKMSMPEKTKKTTAIRLDSFLKTLKKIKPKIASSVRATPSIIKANNIAH